MRKKILVLLCTILACTATACNSSAEFEKNYGEITLGEYKKLSAEKEVYTVTEEDINDSIETLLYDYAVTQTVTRPSKAEDTIYLTMTATKDEEVLMDYKADDEYSIFLGYDEFGSEFDKKLTGVSTGDELTFSITYEEDFDLTDFAGATINFDIHVLKITEDVLPELTDSFITEKLQYESREDLISNVRADLESEHASNSSADLRENLINQVIDNSTFGDYSQDLYDKHAALVEETYTNYASMFGYESVDDIYEAFGMTEKDVKDEILAGVHREITVTAIANKEDLHLSGNAYKEALEVFATDSGYENTELLLEDYDEENVRAWILEEDVLDFLEEHAVITEVEATEEEDAEEEIEEETDEETNEETDEEE